LECASFAEKPASIKGSCAIAMMERTPMSSKTKQSGRADFLLRMPEQMKLRLAKAAAEKGVSANDWIVASIEQMLDDRDAERSIVSVDKGRGFVVQNDYGDPCIITAAHCLPKLPDQAYGMEDAELWHDNLIGPLGEKPSVLAQVIFVDPLADIAVLSGWNKDYEALTAHPILVSCPLVDERCHARVLSLKGTLVDVQVRRKRTGRIWLTDAHKKIAGGMSGSPIIALDGTAIGVLTQAIITDYPDQETEQPCIIDCLPPRLAISTKGGGRAEDFLKERDAERAALAKKGRA
jgi:hypothetical protein